MTPTLEIAERKAGTFTILLKRGAAAQVWRAGIETREEAERRAAMIADMCGYKVKRARKARPKSSGEEPRKESEAMSISEQQQANVAASKSGKTAICPGSKRPALFFQEKNGKRVAVCDVCGSARPPQQRKDGVELVRYHSPSTGRRAKPKASAGAQHSPSVVADAVRAAATAPSAEAQEAQKSREGDAAMAQAEVQAEREDNAALHEAGRTKEQKAECPDCGNLISKSNLSKHRKRHAA